MRKLIIAFSILSVLACMDADFENEELCTYVICGDTFTDQVNITIFNDTEVDFKEIIWSISGEVDTINVLAFDQFSCWRNIDTIKTDYLFAHATSEEVSYLSDTLFFDETDIDTLSTGNFLLRLSLEDQRELEFSWEEGYSGECVSFK